jgi:hypothetical protein
VSLIFLCPADKLLAVDSPHPGAVIYEKMCTECHGKDGQGVDGKYDEPLTGERTLEALIRKIEKTMPEDKEGTCVGEDAKAVASYIYDAFYSVAAQAKLSPPVKDLTRLTISQYRNSIMDLVGRFHNGPGYDRPITAERGLKGFYRGFELPKPEAPKPVERLAEEKQLEELKAAKADEKRIAEATKALKKAIERQKQKQRKEEEEKENKRKRTQFERLETKIAFHFGSDSPDKAKLVASEFNNRWDGSVVANETGIYEFMVKTENGVRLFVNDDVEPLIDGWVSNGPEVREEKKSLYLVGGRAYRLILEHFKFKEQSASVELWWKPPHGAIEIIPEHALRTDRPQAQMIVNTAFPADDRSVGYERGSSISKAWEQATTDAAIATAEHIESRVDRLAGTKSDAPDRGEKLKQFALNFTESAFRHPLTDEQRQLYVEQHFNTSKTADQAVKRVVLFSLKSPQFLYPALPRNEMPDAFDIASRLALNLWDSIPDRKLSQAAASGRLKTRDQIKVEAQRMINDPRAKSKIQGFFHQWLDLEHAENTSKDPKTFPGFNSDVLADLRESLLEFVDQVVWSEKSDYRELLQADYLLLNERLGIFYDQPIKGDAFQRVTFDPKQRAGVVTHPYLLASMAYSRQTSPIHRGVFLTRNIVGMAIKPPPMAVTFDESHFNPSLTMREKITELTRNNSCMSCHSTINPLGFSLENFDAIGRWRTKDNNKPVNAISDFADDDGKTIRLTGPRDIVNYVANNPAGHRAFIRHLFNHLIKQPTPAYGQNIVEKLQQNFAASGCNIQKLLAEIALIDATDGFQFAEKPEPKATP